MPRQLDSSVLVIASHNPGKAAEVAGLFEAHGFQLLTASELGLPEPVEDADSFAGNAAIKARAAALATGHPAVADDSGLVVPALGGDPGVRSRRWSPSSDYAEAMERVHDALGDRSRAAEMVCALALAWPDGDVEAFEGRVRGSLVWPPRGDLGFGYEPMFVPDGSEQTYGEMARRDKHVDDPRARAFSALRSRILGPAQRQ